MLGNILKTLQDGLLRDRFFDGYKLLLIRDEKNIMQFNVEMEDGSFEMVADCFMSKDLFRLHQWGNIWLVATLTDDVKLIGEDSSEILMGDLRKLEAGVTTTVKSGGELRRTRSFKGKNGIVLDARPFSNKK